jgi:hypothetical protein
MDFIFRTIFFNNILLTSYQEQNYESVDNKTLILLKIIIFFKLVIKVLYIYAFLQIWNKTLLYLKYAFISLKEYDTLARVIENKNKIIANAAQELLTREPNRCKNGQSGEINRVKDSIIQKKVLSAHF